MDPVQLKRNFGSDITFWGGCVNTQHTMYQTPEEVYREVRERIDIFNQDGGFVCNAVHNIQGNSPIENVLAMFKAIRDSTAELLTPDFISGATTVPNPRLPYCRSASSPRWAGCSSATTPASSPAPSSSLTARFHLDVVMKGWASGCVLIGCATGVLIVGPISDRFGRKKALLLAAATLPGLGHRHRPAAGHLDLHPVPLAGRHRHRHRLHVHADVYRRDRPGPPARTPGVRQPDRHRRAASWSCISSITSSPATAIQAWNEATSAGAGCSPAAFCPPSPFALLLLRDPGKPALAGRDGACRAGQDHSHARWPGEDFAATELASIHAALSRRQGNLGRTVLPHAAASAGRWHLCWPSSSKSPASTCSSISAPPSSRT